jgi:hypothetical protein
MTTRFGVHTPSNYYWVPRDLDAWCEDALKHGVNCVTVWSNDKYQVDFCRALIRHGIEVIYRPGENKIPSQFIGDIYAAYRDVGVRYLQYYNEPNNRIEWKEDRKAGPEYFAQLWADKCAAIKSIGMIPVVPPLSPGGDIWHPDFFVRMMNWWKNQGLLPDLLRGCILGIHNRPTVNPPDATGVCSFEGYKFFREQMQAIMGFTLPMVAPEAGYEPPNVNHDWEKWKDWNLELIRRFRPKHPKYVGDDFLWHNFWIYSDSGSTWDECGLVTNWYYGQDHNGDTTTNLWRALEVEDWNSVPEPTPTPPTPDPPAPPTPGGIDFVGLSEEMIERLSVAGPDKPNEAYWKITRVEIQPQTDNLNCWLIPPKGVACPRGLFSWPGNEVQMEWKGPDPLNPPGTRDGAYAQVMNHAWGSYGMRVYGNSQSIFGFGLYGDNLELTYTAHHPVLVYYELTEPTPPTPTDPLEVIMPLAKEFIAGLPCPNDWAYPAMAIGKGFGWQVGGFSHVSIDGKLWGYQTFTNADQSAYGVAYSPEGEYDKTAWAVIPRD